jgi:hypothetical protein
VLALAFMRAGKTALKKEHCQFFYSTISLKEPILMLGNDILLLGMG